ncbi:MAG: type I glyceraldehyde-3-phosphate dehydrogenase [Bacteroidetes bacterium]|nr:type I glyceraldehyde-3-phosphate dehydrogenase [Bacteroidota bacterium]
MKKIRIAINGFGRIGRMTARVILHNPNLELVAVNDLTDSFTLAHLFKYDSIHRKFDGTILVVPGGIQVNGNPVRVFSEKDPSRLPWKDLEIDVVLECTGKILDAAGAGLHLEAGARKVILSAPSKEKDGVKTYVIGVNDHLLTQDQRVISNASCTTNNAAPMLKVLDENWGIDLAYVTTIHSYTGDQNIHDAPHRDLRRARAAAVSIIPTTTGAAKALNDVLPGLKGKIGGAGVRVPVPDGSLTDITCTLHKKATIEEINKVFKSASENELKNILQYTEDPIVSVDIVDNPHSCIFDSQLTSVLGQMAKVVGWYDNEIGYSNRLAELAERIG